MKKSIVPGESQHYSNDWCSSPTIKSGGAVCPSGVTAAHEDKSISQHPEEQFHDVLYKLRVYLETVGLTYENILEAVTFHIDLKKHIDLFSRVKDRYIKVPCPAWTTIDVSEFIPENALAEMRIVIKLEVA